MTFPAYPNYKSTGVEWLSEIPANWELIRLRFLLLDGAEGIKIGPFGSQLTSDMLVEVGYKVYGQENVIAGDFDKGQRYITDEKFSEMSVYEISPNDLLVTMMGTAGRCKVVPEAISAGVMDSHLLRMRFCQKVDPKFVELLIDKSIYVSHQVRLNGKGSIMHGLNSSIIKELLVALPSADEQASILSFLDHETARIDALIEEQQRLIELLKEKRQAVISHAVTKGLDPTVPMKDSGVEWLCEVPAHWSVGNIKYFLEAIGDVDHYMPQSVDKGIPYVMTGDLVELASDIQFEECKQVAYDDYLKLSGRIKTSKGDVVMARYATIGSVSYVDIDTEFLVSYSCVTIKPDLSRVLGIYLFYYFKSDSFLNGIRAQTNTNTQDNVGVGDIKNLKIVLPPAAEQMEIVDYLQSELERLDAISEVSLSTISLAREKRSALISAAVTGKIDVRGWQPPVSVQAPETAVAEAV